MKVTLTHERHSKRCDDGNRRETIIPAGTRAYASRMTYDTVTDGVKNWQTTICIGKLTVHLSAEEARALMTRLADVVQEFDIDLAAAAANEAPLDQIKQARIVRYHARHASVCTGTTGTVRKLTEFSVGMGELNAKDPMQSCRDWLTSRGFVETGCTGSHTHFVKA